MGWTWSHGGPLALSARIGVEERKLSLENGCFGCSLRSEGASGRGRERHRGGETRKIGRFNGTFVSGIGRAGAGERRARNEGERTRTQGNRDGRKGRKRVRKRKLSTEIG